MRRILLAVLIGSAVLVPAFVRAQSDGGRIEVVEVKGLIDGNVERSITTALRDAADEDAELVILQIDSVGVVGAGRFDRLESAIESSKVPVATWVGPEAARAENGARALARAGDIRAIAPGASIGPFRTDDLARAGDTPRGSQARSYSASEAKDAKLADHIVAGVEELLEDVDGTRVNGQRLSTDPGDSTIRFRKGDLLGRALHAAAQPSIVYLLILLALVGIVFELFHPSNGPAGMSGLVAAALAVYGVVTLGASWLGVVLIVLGVIGFCLDLRFGTLSFPTLFGLILLVVGSLMLFPGPHLEVSPWILGFGVVSMFAFMVGAMTRVLRDLRAIARGELEVTDAHPHPEPHTNGATDGS